MAQIKEITFAHVGRNEGCVCDKCGTYITNIVTVHYTDGFTANFGQDCFEKMCKDSRLTDYGMKLMRKALKRIEKHTKEFEMWKTLTYEQAREKGLTHYIDPDSEVNTWSTRESDKSPWCGHPFEEYKDWMLNVWYPARFEEDQKEIARFKKVNFVK